MSPAELRTAHDALGVSAEFLAERIGCHVNMVWRYEHPSRTARLPDHVADAVRDLLNDRECAANRLESELREGEGFIPRFTEPEDQDMAVPEMAGWGTVAHGLLVAEVQRRLQLPVEYR